MAFLFEYGNWIQVTDSDSLKRMLESIWEDRLFTDEEIESNEFVEKGLYQPFLQFDGEKVRAKNYSGFIQRGDQLIEIYPKVFRDSNCQDKSLMLNHLFYWLSYCRKWKFPFTQAGLDVEEVNNFPELIIHLIANQIYTVVANQPLSRYQAVEEALLTPRGKINFNRYLNNSLSKSNFHQIECDYEPFLFDNKINRIIKYCVRLLLNKTHLSENIRILQETIYILDDVTDIPCQLHDVDSIVFNSFYEEYIQTLNSCKLILAQQIYSGTPYDLSQWCLLLPMEYIFEDFIAGFLQTHFNDKWKVEYQKSDLYLSDNPYAFNLQHDIFLTSKQKPNKTIIIDAKYKIREKDYQRDPKKGIAQSDLYQMISYAYKRGCSEVVLIYPNTSESLNEPALFEINSGFDEILRINIKAIEIPFWSVNNISVLEERLKYTLSSIY